MIRRRFALLVCLMWLASCSALRATIAPSSSSPPVPAVSTPHTDYNFAVLGDWGAGTGAEASIAREMCARRLVTPFRDVVTVGDNFYDPDGRATATNYFTPMRCVLSYPGHRWRAVWGNHDVAGNSTRAVLGAQHWYTWSQGHLQFFMLDSNQVESKTQRTWLTQQLAASRAPIKIVVFHHPPYSVGGVHPPDHSVQKNWVPLFERYHVTLVLNGHEHDYEHFLVRGIHYVITGGGGAVVYGCIDESSTLLRCEAVHEFLVVGVSGAHLRITAFAATGEVLDTFAL